MKPIIKIFIGSILVIFLTGIFWHKAALIALVPTIALFIIALYDVSQIEHSIMRNFPILGRSRYFLESIGPKIYQYFVEDDTSGRPINRNHRTLIYSRSKNENDTHPFGTQEDVNAIGYEWADHSMYPKDIRTLTSDPFVQIGNYTASILNVSAMSYGALSKEAILALNHGAALGGFFHNTGEGGISPYHIQGGGDLVWQIGTGYFGCRNELGDFSVEMFKHTVSNRQIKMVEIKLSQGAKPGHGGILPASKNTPEIAAIRGVVPGVDIISPSMHTAFSNADEMLIFISKLKKIAERPVGIKLCLGDRLEFLLLCKAMVEQKIYPDFITIDGGEGGTGAAPLEYSNSIGSPLDTGLSFIHDALIEFNIRQHIKLIASGKIMSGFQIVRAIALGADICTSARGMMMSMGCIQALQCHKNTCPTGIATQDPSLRHGLVASHKFRRVFNYHKNTVHATMDIISSMGLTHTSEITRHKLNRRVSTTDILTFDEIYTVQNNKAIKKLLPMLNLGQNRRLHKI